MLRLIASRHDDDDDALSCLLKWTTKQTMK